MIKSLLLTGFLFLCSMASVAQTLTITDSETGKPLALVSIFTERPWLAVSTNSKGQAPMDAFKKVEKISIRLIGYESKTMTYSDLKASEFKISLKPNPLGMDEVVVSATRWQQSVSEITSQIKTITAKEIQLQNPQTAADLLGASGAVFIQKSQQGGGSPMIRGFATNRLIYTVDGVRMNTAIFRAGNIQNVINLDAFATEQTEILFGPGSVIYGSDAIGGVMSFKTLTPHFSLGDKPLVSGKFVSRYSSVNSEKTGHFDVSVGGTNWASVTSFSSWDFDNLRQGSHGPKDYLKTVYVQRQNGQDVVIDQEDPLLQIPSAYSQTNFMQKVRYRLADTWELNYGFHFSETSPYGRYDRNTRFKSGLPRYAEWFYGPQLWLMHSFSATHSAETFLYDQFTLRLALQQFEESRIDRTLNKTDRTNNTENVNAYSVNLDFTRQIGESNRLFYGFEYIFDDVKSVGTLTDITNGTITAGPARYPMSQWLSAAVYVNHEYLVSDKFTIQSGIRFNHFGLEADFANNLPFYPFPFQTANISNSAITGSVGGVWRPDETLSYRVGLGTAFRSPNVDDIGKVFDSAPGQVVVPNPDLKAEYAWNADLGLTKIFGKLGKLDLSVYYTILTNSMVRRDFQLNGNDSIFYDHQMSKIQAIQNVAEARIYGVQLGILLNLSQGFTVSTDLNYQGGKEELDDGSTNPVRHAAPFFGVTGLKYSHEKLVLQFNVKFQAERSHNDLPPGEQKKTEQYAKDANGETYSPAWYTINLKSQYALNDTFTVTAGLENITDQRYKPYSSGISGAGRNMVMSVIARF